MYNFIFIAGMHRSGTSLLHNIIRSHPLVSGFKNTGMPRDEGQHLQHVYPHDSEFGGPGKFGFEEGAYMDENHPLASPETAAELFKEWSEYWDLSKNYLVEKSPTNTLRTRFLQKLFPNSQFIAIIRHPVAVAYATRKWSKGSIPHLIEHTLICYERFIEDAKYLKRVYIIRYEDFIISPQQYVRKLFSWIGLPPHESDETIHSDINQRYFDRWKKDQENNWNLIFEGFRRFFKRIEEYEKRGQQFGYSFIEPEEVSSMRI